MNAAPSTSPASLTLSATSMASLTTWRSEGRAVHSSVAVGMLERRGLASWLASAVLAEVTRRSKVNRSTAADDSCVPAAAATIETRTLAGGSSVRPGQPTYEQIKRRGGALEPRITASTALLRDAARNYKHQAKLVDRSRLVLAGADRSLQAGRGIAARGASRASP